MPESTSSQASTPTPYCANSVPSTEAHWNQVDTTNILQNAMPLEWNELPTHSIVSVPVSNSLTSDYHVTNNVSNVNVLNNQVIYSPPNYMNIPYQRSAVPNGYTTLNPVRGVNTQIVNRPNVIRTQNGPAIGAPAWPNQTALGRFISQSSGWTSNKTTGGVKKQKRIRTAFTSQQMMELEQEYARTRYLDRARRIELADILRLNERTIKIWFQNRRMKEKKDRAESLEDSEEASTSELSPEIGNMQTPMLSHEQYPCIKNELYTEGNSYVEQYPVSSIPGSMPVTSVSTSIAPVSGPVQNMFPTYMSEADCQAQYQQVNLQVQPYSSSYSEVQELSSDVVPKTEPPTSNPSSILEKSWDLSWIRTIQYEEDYQ